MRGHADGLLAGGGVGDEQHLAGIEKLLQALDLLDERLVDLLAAGGVENLDVAGLAFRPLEGEPGGFLHVLQAGRRGEYRDADLPAEGGQLLDGGGTMQDRTR